MKFYNGYMNELKNVKVIYKGEDTSAVDLLNYVDKMVYKLTMNGFNFKKEYYGRCLNYVANRTDAQLFNESAKKILRVFEMFLEDEEYKAMQELAMTIVEEMRR